nr:chaperonin-like protein [Tanacetum cinerariifolium]
MLELLRKMISVINGENNEDSEKVSCGNWRGFNVFGGDRVPLIEKGAKIAFGESIYKKRWRMYRVAIRKYLGIVNKLRGALKIAALKAPRFGKRKSQYLDDIVVLTGENPMREKTSDDPCKKNTYSDPQFDLSI